MVRYSEYWTIFSIIQMPFEFRSIILHLKREQLKVHYSEVRYSDPQCTRYVPMNKMSHIITESVFFFLEIPKKRCRGRPAKFEIVHRHLCNNKTFNSNPNLKAHLAKDHVPQQVIENFKYL